MKVSEVQKGVSTELFASFFNRERVHGSLETLTWHDSYVNHRTATERLRDFDSIVVPWPVHVIVLVTQPIIHCVRLPWAMHIRSDDMEASTLWALSGRYTEFLFARGEWDFAIKYFIFGPKFPKIYPKFFKVKGGLDNLPCLALWVFHVLIPVRG